MLTRSVTTTSLDFRFPDGTVVFDDVSTTLAGHHVGVVGANGAGKTTLVRLLTGESTPTGGTVDRPATVGLVPQDVTLRSAVAVDELIGIAPVRAALHRIELGTADESDHVALEGTGTSRSGPSRCSATSASHVSSRAGTTSRGSSTPCPAGRRRSSR